ncbi:MAG TPA: arylesterase [Aliiroseovarius sp.]|nr:arylesterase [Aliiroseovarius sp.]
MLGFLLRRFASLAYGIGGAAGKAGAAIALIWLAMLPAMAEPPRIAALGDSLTQGYGLPPEDGLVPQLSRWLAKAGTPAEMINAGVSGDTTAGGLARIGWTLSDKPAALIVALGGNDLLRGLPPAQARANLDGSLRAATGQGLPVLLIGLPAPGNYGPEYAAEFDAIFPELASKYGALLIRDFLAPIRVAMENGVPPARLMQGDGIHPNREGVARIVAVLGPEVQKLIARLQENGSSG